VADGSGVVDEDHRGPETIQVAAYSDLVWVELHTDQGLTGLGETFRNPEATVAST
jgi:galactonate dehydratase